MSRMGACRELRRLELTLSNGISLSWLAPVQPKIDIAHLKAEASMLAQAEIR